MRRKDQGFQELLLVSEETETGLISDKSFISFYRE